MRIGSIHLHAALGKPNGLYIGATSYLHTGIKSLPKRESTQTNKAY